MPEEYAGWVVGYAIGGTVVLIAAILLLWILIATQRITRHALRALEAARRIEANTRPIWALADALEQLEAARDGVEGIEDKAARLAARLPQPSDLEEAKR